MRALLICLISSAAFAGGGSVEGTVTVKIDGKPGFVKNALVYIKGYSTEAPKEVELGQSGRAFEKVVLPVVKGSVVKFSNKELDPTLYHHVFTPGPGARAFKSDKYKPGKSFTTPKLTSEGEITVFCDIHKQMIATIYVVPNDRSVVLSTAEGDKAPFKLDGLRPGKWKVVAWHRSTGKAVEQEIEIVEGKSSKVDLVLDGKGPGDDHPREKGTAYPAVNPDGGTPGERGEVW